VFHHHRDAIPGPSFAPPRGHAVRLLQSDEELQSAVERARAFERRHDPHLRVGVYDQYLSVLADMTIVPPEDIERGTDADARASTTS
jgi:hypothetical protein